MYYMRKTGEFQKIEKLLRSQNRNREADKVHEIYEGMGAYNVPFIPLLLETRNVELLQSAICYMTDSNLMDAHMKGDFDAD